MMTGLSSSSLKGILMGACSSEDLDGVNRFNTRWLPMCHKQSLISTTSSLIELPSLSKGWHNPHPSSVELGQWKSLTTNGLWHFYNIGCMWCEWHSTWATRQHRHPSGREFRCGHIPIGLNEPKNQYGHKCWERVHCGKLQ